MAFSIFVKQIKQRIIDCRILFDVSKTPVNYYISKLFQYSDVCYICKVINLILGDFIIKNFVNYMVRIIIDAFLCGIPCSTDFQGTSLGHSLEVVLLWNVNCDQVN